MSETSYWFFNGNEVEGPLTRDQLTELAAQGGVASVAMVLPFGKSNWIRFSDEFNREPIAQSINAPPLSDLSETNNGRLGRYTLFVVVVITIFGGLIWICGPETEVTIFTISFCLLPFAYAWNKNKNETSSKLSEGGFHLDRQNYDGAIAIYTKMMKGVLVWASPYYVTLLYSRAAAKQAKGDDLGAAKDLSKATKIGQKGSWRLILSFALSINVLFWAIGIFIAILYHLLVSLIHSFR